MGTPHSWQHFRDNWLMHISYTLYSLNEQNYQRLINANFISILVFHACSLFYVSDYKKAHPINHAYWSPLLSQSILNHIWAPFLLNNYLKSTFIKTHWTVGVKFIVWYEKHLLIRKPGLKGLQINDEVINIIRDKVKCF